MTDDEIIAGGVKFIMGPGGDEGTRSCTCGKYPHLPSCGEKEERVFEIPALEGPTPLTDDLVNRRMGRMVALDPAYKYAQALIEHAKAVERLFWRERKSCLGMTGLLAKARAAQSARPAMPEELFDGYAVWKALGEDSGVSQRNVAAVLDAVVRLIRSNQG